ncbi:MAG: signal peptidase I [Clostridia bacterium]
MLKMSDKTKNILEWVACVVIAVVIAIFIRYFIGTPTVVQQPSMVPTLKENQRLILNRLPRTFKQVPERGDIITFEAPSNSYATQLTASYENEPTNVFSKFMYYILEINKMSYIKRVIALPGEHITLEDGKVYINEEELEESYLQPGIKTEAKNPLLIDFVVPDDCIFAMGDNRTQSADCRVFGCIPIEKVESKVWIRFWPFDLFGEVK